jgi:hypothetical protein
VFKLWIRQYPVILICHGFIWTEIKDLYSLILHGSFYHDAEIEDFEYKYFSLGPFRFLLVGFAAMAGLGLIFLHQKISARASGLNLKDL